MNLKEARFLKGLTQMDLQRMTGVFQPRISQEERGRKILREDEKRRIEQVLGLEGAIDWGGNKNVSLQYENEEFL